MPFYKSGFLREFNASVLYQNTHYTVSAMLFDWLIVSDCIYPFVCSVLISADMEKAVFSVKTY